MKNTEKSFVVYCHTNIINNKKYIGITCQPLQLRFRNGKGYKSSPHFYAAIQKYGWESFRHEVLFEELNENEAKSKEIELIKKFNTMNSNFGYNMTSGGEGYSGINNPWYGKHHTEETKKTYEYSKKRCPKIGRMEK